MKTASTEVKALARPLLRKAIKIQQQQKLLSSELSSLKQELQAILSEFELDEIVINNGKVSIVQGSTRKSIADWDILVSKLNELGVDSDLIIRETTSKPSLRITSLK